MGNTGVKFKDSNGNAVYPCPYYPVGSIYMSVNNINPGEFFGGTWEQIKDRFLLACGSTYSNGATGGEANHTLTVDEMPEHSHDVVQRKSSPTPVSSFYNTNYTPSSIQYALTSSAFMCNSGSTDFLFTLPVGKDKSHNNMPPYLAVYVWKRIA